MNFKQCWNGKISNNQKIAKGIFHMTIRCEEAIQNGIIPGQFIHIKIPKAAHLLIRRPISINGVSLEEGMISIVYQIKGEGTARLAALEPGQCIDFIGPLGNGFVLPGHAERIFLVGGGIGIAPLRLVAETWQDRKYHAFLGYRNKQLAYQVDVFRELSDQVTIASEDGSIGAKGFVTELLDEALAEFYPDLILACGPTAMVRSLKKKLELHSIPCLVSLEERMGCGIGGCLVCNCKIGSEEAWRYQRVCKDGPVFEIREVMFDE